MTLILFNDWRKSTCRRSHAKELLGILFSQTQITCHSSIILVRTSQNERNSSKTDKLTTWTRKVRLRHIRRLCAANNQIWSWSYSICLSCLTKSSKNLIFIVAGKEDLNETWKSLSRISQFIGNIKMKTSKEDTNAMLNGVRKMMSSWMKIKQNMRQPKRRNRSLEERIQDINETR